MSWRLARAAAQLKAEVLARWPGTTVWTKGDAAHASRPSDHNPNQGIVSAIDVLGREKAMALWMFLLKTRDARVEYIIFDRKKSGSDYGWRVLNYNGSNPHTNHIHVSFGRGTDSVLTRSDLYDDGSPWGFADAEVPVPNPEEDELMELVAQIQRSLTKAGYDLGDFTPFGNGYPEGADGDWGSKTEGAFVDALTKARTGGGSGGTGPAGSRGPKGPKGDTGARGPAGPPGPKPTIEIDYKD